MNGRADRRETENTNEIFKKKRPKCFPEKTLGRVDRRETKNTNEIFKERPKCFPEKKR